MIAKLEPNEVFVFGSRTARRWIRAAETERRAAAYDELMAVVCEVAEHLYTKQDMERCRAMAVETIARTK